MDLRARHRSFPILAALAFVLVVAPLGLLRTSGAPAGPDQWIEAGVPQWRNEPADAALASAGTRTGRAEQFYFVLPDRFANGDPGNDRGGLTGDRMATGLDPTDRASTTAATCAA